MMMTERGMAALAAGGSVLAQFDTILAAAVPELVRRVEAVAFDAVTGRLDVVPDAPACGTKLRWSAPKLISAANERVLAPMEAGSARRSTTRPRPCRSCRWCAGRATGGCRRCRLACAGRGQGLSTTSGEDSVGSFCAGHVARVFFIAVPSAGVTQRWYFCFTTIWRAT